MPCTNSIYAWDAFLNQKYHIFFENLNILAYKYFMTDHFLSGEEMSDDLMRVLAEAQKTCTWINDINKWNPTKEDLKDYIGKDFWDSIDLDYNYIDYQCSIYLRSNMFYIHISEHYPNVFEWNIPGFDTSYLEFFHVDGKFFVTEIISEDENGDDVLWWRPLYEKNKEYILYLPKC
jgi:hypothetical protein